MSLRSAIRRIPLCRAIGRAWNRRVWLQRARQRQSYSQNGEDRALLDLFPADFKGLYVDLGANHPYFISNTHLLYTRGWHGLCVDALPMFAPLYRRHRPRDVFLNKGVSMTAGAFDFYEMDVPELSTFSRELADDLVASRRAALTAVQLRRARRRRVEEHVRDRRAAAQCVDRLVLEQQQRVTRHLLRLRRGMSLRCVRLAQRGQCERMGARCSGRLLFMYSSLRGPLVCELRA